MGFEDLIIYASRIKGNIVPSLYREREQQYLFTVYG
jgi:hypothetical protein